MTAPRTWFVALTATRDGFRVTLDVDDNRRPYRAHLLLSRTGQLIDLQACGPDGDRLGTTGSAAVDVQLARRAAEELARARAAAAVANADRVARRNADGRRRRR